MVKDRTGLKVEAEVVRCRKKKMDWGDGRESNIYVVYDFYVDPNFAPAGQFLRSVKFLRRSELAPKELIPRCQRDIFAPTDFEIQIWV